MHQGTHLSLETVFQALTLTQICCVNTNIFFWNIQFPWILSIYQWNELRKINFPLEEKCNFEPIDNSDHATQYLELGKKLAC